MFDFMFPNRNNVLIKTRVKTGVNKFGDDVFEEVSYTVENCVTGPVSTSDQAAPRENLDYSTMEAHLPKWFTPDIHNGTFEILTGVNAGKVFEIEGDSLPVDGSPVSWNRRIVGRRSSNV